MKPVILLAEDEPVQRITTRQVLTSRLKLDVLLAENGRQAVEAVQADTNEEIALLLIDLNMPVMNGMEAIRRIREIRPKLPFIVLTGSDDLDDAVEAMRLGASDFIVKPAEFERLVVSVRNALDMRDLRQQITQMQRRGRNIYTLDDIAGISHGLRGLVQTAKKAAHSMLPILITGKSGVGKEVFAKAIHLEGARADKPFIAINCGALPENLVESTLFGHEKGAFTGAINKSTGKCREADGGVLFLDEVGELRPEIQVKLLRLLQEGEIQPIGSNQTVKVDVRIISATNQVLPEMIAARKFREDLYYRLQGIPLHIPSLSERRGDVLPLAEHLLQKIAYVENRPGLRLTADAKAWLKRYHWPGNVRELQHILARASLISEVDELDEQTLCRWTQAPVIPDAASPEFISLLTANGTSRTLAELESEILQAALKRHRNHIGQTAAALGIGQSTLYKKLDKATTKPQD